MKKIIPILIVMALLITGCGDFFSGDSGELIMSISDAPVNDIAEVNVTLDRVEVQSEEEGWQVLNDFDGATKTFDLLTLRFDEELLGQEMLAEGNYNQIRLILAAKEDQSDVGPPNANQSHIVYQDDTNDDVNLFVPSGTQTGLKINHQFRIEDGAITRLLLDVDVREILNDLPEKAQHGYILRPTAINVIDQVISGDIEGVAVDANGNPITEYDVIVEAKDANGETITSTVATTEEEDGREAGSFKLRGLEEGTYSLTAYAVEYLEDDEENIVYQTKEANELEVEVTAEEVLTLDENLILKELTN